MKFVPLILLFALPAAALQPLDAFVSSALQHSPDALEATANAAFQHAQSDVAFGRALPGIAARGTYTRNQYDVKFTFNGQEVTLLPIEQWDAYATLNVPLIDLASWTRVAAARTAASAADRQLAAAKLSVQAQVTQQYFQLVANIALLSSAKQFLDVSKESLRLAQNRNAAGVAPAIDVDRAQADVEAQNQQVAGADLQVAIAARALESTSGLQPAIAPVALDDDLHEEPKLETFQQDVNDLPAVKAAMETTQAAEQQAKAQRYTLVPALAGSITEHGTNAPGFVGQNWTWQGVVALTWGLDFTTFANIRGQDAAADVSRAREERTRLAAADAIHREWETVSAGIARSRAARAGRSAAARAADQARDRYSAGAITQLELLQAQRDAFAAEVARIQADADLINARVQLQLAAGRGK